jgi:hypothetical protein
VLCAAQVAERSLFLWNNEYIVSLVAQQRNAVLPLVFASLERNERNHWNPQVRSSARHAAGRHHKDALCKSILGALKRALAAQARAL